ncbi:hypothetical protein LIER_30454 [Lithospermum erythrorhizon]|uniref:Uncharacterized protein n=1 Tax=Lithospermum erythrorhizon TaxID=34254 RepID=A0AAV3RRE6_LITER
MIPSGSIQEVEDLIIGTYIHQSPQARQREVVFGASFVKGCRGCVVSSPGSSSYAFFAWVTLLGNCPVAQTTGNIPEPFFSSADASRTPPVVGNFIFKWSGYAIARKAVRMRCPMRPFYEGSDISTTLNDALIVTVLGASPTVNSKSAIPTGYIECPVNPVRGVHAGFKRFQGNPNQSNAPRYRISLNYPYPATFLLRKN